MISEIDFMSCTRFESLTGDPGLAVISITDTGSSNARIHPLFGPALRLKFDDLDDRDLATGSSGTIFSQTDAQSVISFLDRVHSISDTRGLIVHCEMGRSRSAAVAWYALAYGGSLTKERRIDGINLLVLKRLEEAGRRQLPRPTGMLAPAGFSLVNGQR